MNRARRGRERGHQDQAGGIRGIAVAITAVDLFSLGIPAVGDVMGDGFAEGRIDGADFGGDLVNAEIEVIGVNQIGRVRPTGIPEVGDHHLHQPDDAPGLLEAFVFLELADQLAEIGMEGVGIHDPGVEGLGRGSGQAHVGGFSQRFAVGAGHPLDFGFRGDLLE